MKKMKLLSERLRWAKSRKEEISATPLSWAALSRKCGATPAAVSRWVNDLNGIDSEYARPLAAYLQVDPVWLETGDGSPALSDSEIAASENSPITRDHIDADEIIELITLYKQSTGKGRQFILDSAHGAEKISKGRRGSASGD
jgi:transcriptional regulator with XRE-family HTH domain